MFAWDQGEGFGDVAAEFFGGASAPWIAAGDSESSVVGIIVMFEPLDIVSLPAVQGDGEGGELLEGAVTVDAEGGVALASEGVGLRRERFLAGGT